MKDNNITVGCNPPANTNYCPDNNVTRGEMATFMKRLAENNVVDAATLDGVDSTEFVQKGEADSVTPAMTTAEPGVAQTIEPNSIDLVAAATTATSVTLNAPADGFAIVFMDTDVQVTHVMGTASIIQVGISDTADVLGPDEDKTLQIPGPLATATYNENQSMTKVFSVTAGANTFYLVGSGAPGALFDTHLSAIYVGSSYGTVDLAGTIEGDDNETGG
jgi:hypothetical protein